uniref:Derlin n=1 Tax=Elaeophora elaphi TaxID=1147741 RepID=A0A0R3RZ64_9BILA
MSEFSDWYFGVPEITRYWFTGSVILPLLGRFGLFSPYLMLLEWNLFFHKFQIWRPLTALFYYPLTPSSGFHWLLMLYFMYNYSRGTETGLFDGRPADYLFMLIFNWIVCTIICLAAGVYFLLEPMVLSVLYIWCQMNKDQIVQFWFGTQFKAMYLPWILVGFNMILRGGGMNELIGILVGHAYYFLMFKYPQDFGGHAFLQTPQILYRWFPNRTNVVHGFGQAPSYRRTDAGDGGTGRHNWGQGRPLGGPD